MPAHQDVWKKTSKILKLLPIHNCFTLAMTNKLVDITNSLKVPKIKKILLYEMKFLVPNYSCLENPWLGGYHPQIPVLSVLNWICWNPPPEKNSWVRHCLQSPVSTHDSPAELPVSSQDARFAFIIKYGCKKLQQVYSAGNVYARKLLLTVIMNVDSLVSQQHLSSWTDSRTTLP